MRKLYRFIAFGYFAIVVVSVLLQMTGLMQFGAPLSIIPTPQRPPIVVTLGYSSEQSKWLTTAAQQFAATNPTLGGRPIQIALRSQSSLALLDDVAADRFQPTAIIPAGSSLLEAFERDWDSQHGGLPIIAVSGPNKPQPVALSPLVLVSWQERADRLFPSGTTDVWQRLHDALTKTTWGDSTLGGKQEWGPVKLGLASPLRANSGVEGLILLAYAYHHKTQGLTLGDIHDPGFGTWLQDVAVGVNDSPDSTDALMSSFLVKGRSAYDVAIVYESQVVSNYQNAPSDVRVLYPAATMWSDHPFVVLSGDWVSSEQQEAARFFRDFLLTQDTQRLARAYGFRPAIAGIGIDENVPDNPFLGAKAIGVQQITTGNVAVPAPEVLDALQQEWQKLHG